MPQIEENSEIIGTEKFETIWEWLPSIYRISDPVLVFKSSRDGYFLQNLYNKLKGQNKPMLLLIKTSEDIVFSCLKYFFQLIIRFLVLFQQNQ